MVTLTPSSAPWHDGIAVPRRRLRILRRIADLLIGAWTAGRDGGQLGPEPRATIGRHAGARI